MGGNGSVLVIGGTGGIGREVAPHYAGRGERDHHRPLPERANKGRRGDRGGGQRPGLRPLGTGNDR